MGRRNRRRSQSRDSSEMEDGTTEMWMELPNVIYRQPQRPPQKNDSVIRRSTSVGHDLASILDPKADDVASKFTVPTATFYESELDKKPSVRPGSTLLFEVSTEVATKSGGIHTVIKSKAEKTTSDWGDKYCLIGPYNEAAARSEFEPLDAEGPLKETIQNVEQTHGMRCYYGRWLIPGMPRVILIDIHTQWEKINSLKGQMWERFQYSSPDGISDNEVNEVLLFGFQVYWFFEELKRWMPDFPMIVQFHEWLAGGVALPLLRNSNINLGLVFTTHATLLGRYMCAGSSDFYNSLEDVDADEEAHNRCIYARHHLEKMATHSAHVFTTVSDITGLEAKYLLHREPDMILPNGLNVDKYTEPHEVQNLHLSNKSKIDEFVRGHFRGFLNWDMDKTIYLCTAGRYEYSNKGYDMYIESLARLNHILKSDKENDKTVVAFLITRSPHAQGYNREALEGASHVRALRQNVDKIQSDVTTRIFDSLIKGQIPSTSDLLSKDDIIQMKRQILAMQKSGLPPITTHNLSNSETDPVLTKLRECGLNNHPSDPVKIVAHMDFVSALSPVLPLDYHEFIRGCHLTVFPSYYEPWGLTPAESVIMGTPTITTNLAGFGNWVERHAPDQGKPSITVIDRRYCSPEESMNRLVNSVYDFTRKNRKGRIELRNRTVRLGELFDWGSLGEHYEEARMLSKERAHINTPHSPEE